MSSISFESARWTEYVATMAPLPEHYIKHLLHHVSLLRDFPLHSPSFAQFWGSVKRTRETVSYLLVPTVGEGGATTERLTQSTFRNFFISYGPGIGLSTVDRWIENRHLRTVRKFGSLEPNSVATIYMMRHLFEATHTHFLPNRIRRNLPRPPWFSVWGMGPTDPTPHVYPYPLPQDLPARTLLWTHWIGASWLPGFVSVPGIGALAWGKTTTIGSKWYWDVSIEDMQSWDEAFLARSTIQERFATFEKHYSRLPAADLPDADRRYRVSRLHNLATSLLEQIGEPLLTGYVEHYFECDTPPAEPYQP